MRRDANGNITPFATPQRFYRNLELAPDGVETMRLVLEGKVDLGVTQISEIVQANRAALVGPFPKEFDLATTYRVPVFRTLSPWVKLEVLNVTNNQKVIQWNTTVTPDRNSPLDQYGLPTGFIRGARFGQASE